MSTRYTRNPRKRIIRGASSDELRPGGRRTSEEFDTGGDGEFPFVRVGNSVIGTQQDVVQRVGTAIIGGDFSGNARGNRSIDVQGERNNTNQVASGEFSIVFGSIIRVEGSGSLAFGYDLDVAGEYGVAVGNSSIVSGTAGLLLGQGQVTGNYGIAIGQGDVESSGDSAIALGSSATASGTRSIALGENALADQNDEFVIRALSIRMQTQSAPGTEEAVITTSVAAPVTGNLVTWADVDRIGDAGVSAAGLVSAVTTSWNFLLLSASATFQAALDRLDTYGMFVKTTVQSGVTLTIPSGYQQLVGGPYTVTGDIALSGDLLIL